MNIECGRCGKWLKHHARGMCRNCYQYVNHVARTKPQQVGAANEDITLEELEEMIAENYLTMPPEMEADWRHQEGSGGDDTGRRVAGVCRILLVPGRRKR